MDINDQLINYFNQNRIPFHHNKLNILWNLNSHTYQLCRNQFIIPGKIIFPATYSTLVHSDGQIRLEKALMLLHQHKVVQSVYIIIHSIPEDVIISPTLLKDSGINTFSLNVSVVDKLTDIVPEPYIYYISSCGPLYSITMKEDVSELNNIKYPIVCIKNTYNNGVIFMTPEERGNLKKKVSIEIVDMEPSVLYKVMFVNKLPNGSKYNYLYNFAYQLSYEGLPGGIRTPLIHIPTVTDYCVTCKALYKVKYLNGEKVCFHCENDKIE